MSYLTVPRSIRLEEMYLVRGLGVDGINIGFGGRGGRGHGGDDLTPLAFGREGDGNGARAEEHYQKLLDENPGNSLFLRNYAQFLYEARWFLAGMGCGGLRAALALDPVCIVVLLHQVPVGLEGCFA
ncbi:hypothetical protein U1Q18_048612 [Sarracenia purpurea var. burkii]